MSVEVTVAIVGGSFSLVVGFLGFILNRTIAARSHQLHLEAEQRNRTEAAIKALEVIKGEHGEPSPREVVSGAIVSLVDLGLVRLALFLLQDLDAEVFSERCAAHVIERGLAEEMDDLTQSEAAEAYGNLAAQMPNVTPIQIFWEYPWAVYLPKEAKLDLIQGKWEALLASDRVLPENSRGAHGILAVLQQDPDSEIKRAAAGVLKVILPHSNPALVWETTEFEDLALRSRLAAMARRFRKAPQTPRRLRTRQTPSAAIEQQISASLALSDTSQGWELDLLRRYEAYYCDRGEAEDGTPDPPAEVSARKRL